MKRTNVSACLAPLAILAVALPDVACAADIDGARLSVSWALPFVGVLLSIALMPLLAAPIWHAHFGKISVAWALATLVPLAVRFGPGAAFGIAWHTLALEYLPFLMFLGALFVVASGIHIRGNLHGSPALNTALLAIGALLASVMGTTGASMLLISPMIRANDGRRYRVHTIVFFIFIVANIGGSLTPLGDPPLFLGFLKGVDFFWTVRHMAGPMLLQLCVLLPLFYVIDFVLYRRELAQGLRRDPTPDSPFGLDGKVNLLLIVALVAVVIVSGLWKTDASFDVFGVDYALPGAMRDIAFLLIAGLSWMLTPRPVRKANHFSWAPLAEVAKLFFGIFITMAPVLLMLRAGSAGAFAPIVSLVVDSQGQPNNAMYFWLTGALSSFLDNAPTYLVFFNLASGDAQELMTSLPTTLTAISAGAVFMGANTYIGNAPNFMVKAIAESRGITMPNFFAYMAWSVGILLPIFALTTFVFFR